MSDSEIHHLASAYALDALDERERAAFEAHYATCAVCRTDVREMRDAAAELATLTASAPPAHVRSRVLAEIATTRQLSPLPGAVVRLGDRRRSRPLVAVAAVAAAAVCFVVGAVVFSGSGSGSDVGEEVAAMMTEPGVGVAHLAGDATGTVTVVWDDERAAVLAAELPPPGNGRGYELWLIDGEGRPIPMRLLAEPDDGEVRAIVPLADDVEPAAWGVTIEPSSGSDAPTSDVLFSAAVEA